ncbi:MAG: hypothetical protein AAGA90_02460 [Actinomycetota bacterium]
MGDLLAAVVGFGLVGLVIGMPMWLTGRAFRAVLARRARLVQALGARGAVHRFDTPLTIGVILVGAGAVFAAIMLLPLVIWAVDGDTDARRVFLAFVPIIAAFAGGGWLMARPGFRLVLAEPDRLTVHRSGVRHRLPPAGEERSIAHDEIVGFHERRSVLGSLDIHGSGAVDRLRISAQTSGFDELVAVLRRAAPDARHTTHRDRTTSTSAPADAATSWAVPRWQTRLLIAFLASMLIFFWAWPWFVVTGDHPTRDSFLFMGIGTLLWSVIAFLVGQENFQRRQPARLELRPGRVAWRVFRGPWVERPVTDVITATVETDIVYVRGFPGYRHPLRLRFVGGEQLLVDDARARHLRTSTVQLGAAIRRHVHDLGSRTDDDRRRADEHDRAAAGTDADEAARHRGAAVAAWPDRERLAGLAAIGDLHRQAGDHALAVSLYRAQIDVDADRAEVWLGLAASLQATGRDDLAAEAIAEAERIRRRDTS